MSPTAWDPSTLPFLEVSKEIFLLSGRSRGKGINLLSGNHACLAAPEIIKILLCDSSPVLNRVAMCLAEVGEDLECLQHTISMGNYVGLVYFLREICLTDTVEVSTVQHKFFCVVTQVFLTLQCEKNT